MQILKVEHKSFQWCIICHIWTSNMGFRGGGGGKLTPPQHILVFKYPSRDRVKKHFWLIDNDYRIVAQQSKKLKCQFGILAWLNINIKKKKKTLFILSYKFSALNKRYQVYKKVKVTTTTSSYIFVALDSNICFLASVSVHNLKV